MNTAVVVVVSLVRVDVTVGMVVAVDVAVDVAVELEVIGMIWGCELSSPSTWLILIKKSARKDAIDTRDIYNVANGVHARWR